MPGIMRIMDKCGTIITRDVNGLLLSWFKLAYDSYVIRGKCSVLGGWRVVG